MPSVNQSNTVRPTYETEAEKMIRSKSEETILACIRGLRTVDDCEEWLAVEVANDRRKRIVAALNRRKMDLTGE